VQPTILCGGRLMLFHNAQGGRSMLLLELRYQFGSDAVVMSALE
jgi:hypothetical protein